MVKCDKGQAITLGLSQRGRIAWAALAMCLCFFDGGGFKATSRWAVVNLSGADYSQAPERKLFGFTFLKTFWINIPWKDKNDCSTTSRSCQDSGHIDAIRTGSTAGTGDARRMGIGKVIHINRWQDSHRNPHKVRSGWETVMVLSYSTQNLSYRNGVIYG